MSSSNVAINIAAEFIGKKAFKQADSATAKLSKSVKTLAGSLGLAFGARGIGRAVKAFAEDDKAARALGQTLNNLGLAFGSNSATVNGYISRLEQQTGVLDDELRPAMDRFLRSTMSVSKSQELLNLALDISAGTGKSVTQVSQSLQKAYLGQTQALGRLGVGLSKAELTSATFEEIQARLSVLFAGQASVAAGTYAGEIAKLQVAVNNAKETIGKGFVDALKTASGSSTIDPVIAGIGKIADAFAYVTRETGKFIAITKDAFQNPSWFAPSGGLFGDGKGMGNISMTVASQDTQKADLAAKKKADALAAAQAAKLLKLEKAATKAQQDSLKINKAKAIFDLQKIQIAAALKGSLSDEERARLLLMQAIEDENVKLIDKYTKLLDEAQKKTKELQGQLDTIKTTTFANPFSTWTGSIETAVEALKNLKGDALYIAQLATPISGQYDPRVLTAGQRIDSAGNYVSYNPAMAAAGMTANPFAPSAAASAPAPVINQTNNFNGVVTDPVGTANQLKVILEEAANQVGNRYGLGTGSKDVFYIV